MPCANAVSNWYRSSARSAVQIGTPSYKTRSMQLRAQSARLLLSQRSALSCAIDVPRGRIRCISVSKPAATATTSETHHFRERRRVCDVRHRKHDLACGLRVLGLQRAEGDRLRGGRRVREARSFTTRATRATSKPLHRRCLASGCWRLERLLAALPDAVVLHGMLPDNKNRCAAAMLDSTSRSSHGSLTVSGSTSEGSEAQGASEPDPRPTLSTAASP